MSDAKKTQTQKESQMSRERALTENEILEFVETHPDMTRDEIIDALREKKMKTTVHHYYITAGDTYITTGWGESEADAYAHLPSHITEAHPIDDLAFRVTATAERTVDARTEAEKAEAEARDEEKRIAQSERIMESKASLEHCGDYDPKAGTEDECCG